MGNSKSHSKVKEHHRASGISLIAEVTLNENNVLYDIRKLKNELQYLKQREDCCSLIVAIEPDLEYVLDIDDKNLLSSEQRKELTNRIIEGLNLSKESCYKMEFKPICYVNNIRYYDIFSNLSQTKMSSLGKPCMNTSTQRKENSCIFVAINQAQGTFYDRCVTLRTCIFPLPSKGFQLKVNYMYIVNVNNALPYIKISMAIQINLMQMLIKTINYNKINMQRWYYDQYFSGNSWNLKEIEYSLQIFEMFRWNPVNSLYFATPKPTKELSFEKVISLLRQVLQKVLSKTLAFRSIENDLSSTRYMNVLSRLPEHNQVCSFLFSMKNARCQRTLYLCSVFPHYCMTFLNTLWNYCIILALNLWHCTTLLKKEENTATKPSYSMTVALSMISCIVLSCTAKRNKNSKTKYFDKTFCDVLKDKMYIHFKEPNNKKLLKEVLNQNFVGQTSTFFVYPVTNLLHADLSNEMQRVGTFHSFPDENVPSFIRCAASGFYYTGKAREVQCFSCNASYSDWSYKLDPVDVHRKISPRCTFLNSCESDGSNSKENENLLSPDITNAAESIIATDSGFKDKDQYVLPSSSSSTLLTRHSANGFGSNSGYSSNSMQFCDNRSQSSYLVNSHDSGYDSSQSLNQLSNNSSDLQKDSQGLHLPTIAESNYCNGNISKNSVTTVPVTPPKYPEYQNVEKRKDSYRTWPKHLTFLHPPDLAECGFFYSNFGDCVRCYQCGIGLRNWESDDNPWVEHARWSRKCQYLIRKKGQGFIDSVLSLLGLQTDAEIEESAKAPSEPLIPTQTPTFNGLQSKEDGDPLTHEAAKYVIREKIFGSNLEFVKRGMDDLLSNNDWRVITKEMLIENLLEKQQMTGEFRDTDNRASHASHKKESKSEIGKEEGDKRKEVTIDKSMSKSQTAIDPEKAQKENEELKDLYTCKICLDEKVGITFVPCGHLVTCKKCSPKLRRCPLCRQFIRGTIKTTI